MNKIKYSNQSTDYPKGFITNSVNCGLLENRDDLTLIYSVKPAKCAIVLTSNQVKAAPVIWDSEITLDGSDKQAIIANVKTANACTGELGYENTRAMAELVASGLGLDPKEVLVCSTGVIGQQLDMTKIETGILDVNELILNEDSNGMKASKAILTTDTKAKTVSAEFKLDGKTIKIGAMAKGSGMIRPNMATMLSFTTTDCNIEQSVLQEALSRIAQDTYNMISVDGDMSTNDTAIILANGLAGNCPIESLNTENGKIFYEALFNVEKDLAKKIVEDGEGATKFVEVNITQAQNEKEARILARAVAESNLVKTAIFGGDANWGRIISSLGASNAKFDPEKAELKIEDLVIFKNGKPTDYSEEEATKIFKNNEIIINIDCNLGSAKATAWGCDLSYDYVKINGDYRT